MFKYVVTKCNYLHFANYDNTVQYNSAVKTQDKTYTLHNDVP